MSLAEMQAFLGKLYVDRTARRLFALQPEVVLHDYVLTGEERQAILSLDLDRVERFAVGLLRKRERRIRELFPLFTRYAAQTHQRLFDRFYHLQTPTPGQASGAWGLAYGAFAVASLAGLPDETPPGAADLLQYEALLAARAQHAANGRGTPETGEQDPFPRRRTGVQVVSFGCDVIRLAEAVSTGEEIQGALGREIVLAFPPAEQGRVTDCLELNAGAELLLELCDGSTDVDGLRGAIASRLRAPVSLASVRECLALLRGHELVTGATAC